LAQVDIEGGGRMQDLWLVSVDDHVIEPEHVWQDRLPARHRDLGPKWVRDDSGAAWTYEDVRVPVNATVTGAANLDPADMPPVWDPLDFDRINPACYDPVARVGVMDADHVLSSILFPNLPRFCGQLFAESKDKELGMLCVRAYNDWMIDEWCAAAPGRFIPNVLIPLWDPAAAARELERCADLGARAFCFSQAPHRLGLPSIHDPDGYWDPVFATADHTGMVLCTHLGSASQLPDSAPDAPIMVSTTLLQFAGQETLLDWLFGRPFDRFPNLKVCLSENGIGWIPAVLEVAEWFMEAGRRGQPVPGQPGPAGDEAADPAPAAAPAAMDRAGRAVKGFLGAGSAADMRRFGAGRRGGAFDLRARFRDHIFGCFIKDDHGVRSIDELGFDNVMMETDFPHMSSSYPHTSEAAARALTALTAEQRDKLLTGNAARLFHWEDELADVRRDLGLGAAVGR
jgi:predicted TIM-barrel fold metal-dependent hydrolase